MQMIFIEGKNAPPYHFDKLKNKRKILWSAERN
jgi:hypothetical protein